VSLRDWTLPEWRAQLHDLGPLPDVIQVGHKKIGRGQKPFMIAEIGNNHNGDLDLAKKTIDAAEFAKADAVKFQKRNLNAVFTKEMQNTPQMFHQSLGKTYGEYRKTLELSDDVLRETKEHAEKKGLIWFSTPFDEKSADTLFEMGVKLFKLASFDATNTPLLTHVAKMGLPILLSTGMSTAAEIFLAVRTILTHNKNLVLLHCKSIYPTPEADTNLGAIRTLKEWLSPLPVGYSGHEIGYKPTLLALSLGASVIERHFTLDKELSGPDHATVSLDALEFTQMVKDATKFSVSLSSDEIGLSEKEMAARNKHSKSLVTVAALPAGTVLTKNMLTCKSPGKGIKPYRLDEVIGMTVTSDIPEDTVLEEKHLKELS
jgi:sialic acid synthase SpsE